MVDEWDADFITVQEHLDALNEVLEADLELRQYRQWDDFAMMVAGSGSASFAEVLAAIDAEFHAVPEPTAAAMLVVGGLLLTAVCPLHRHRRRRCDSGN